MRRRHDLLLYVGVLILVVSFVWQFLVIRSQQQRIDALKWQLTNVEPLQGQVANFTEECTDRIDAPR